MNDVAETLDPLRLPLTGERLIEASAGTGKTFTIAALYLRLLLGLGGSAAFPRPLTVEELLVVTFTEAATEELRGRIRSNIHELRIACLRESTDNPLYARLLEEISDKSRPRSGYYWRNDKWTRPRSLPSTVFASVCSA
ncbi:exonuclease V subunit [Salmonella enterica subsp. enterica]|uniref:Exonuclease V subunit n=1 Tax=Salmonella enterica I TaxID=59201 RepID=A0A379WMD5_SALET|nr:exonuclease V subunit [Salmonella enterica subsp. enterica]